ncbi:MAG: DUF1275 family protein [Phycisphaeraceae bacterium]|nr:DUF1275 family protein [Phycisphaeraceae bacterium]
MFVGQAHSFVQQARLAVTLAWVAGYTNLIAILVCGSVTSHVSGTTSNLGRDMAEGMLGSGDAWPLAGYAVFLLGTFLLGAVLSGVMTELGRRRGWESIYVLPMAAEAALLLVFAVGVEQVGPAGAMVGAGHYWMTGVASAAMGLQNATITRISSGVVRTTHVTGVVTDLGLELVQFVWWLVDRPRDVPPGSMRSLVRGLRTHPTPRRLVLLASIIGSFAFGAFLGTLIHWAEPRLAMIPPVLFLVWIVYQDLVRPIAEIQPSDLISNGTVGGLPGELAVFHLKKDATRKGTVHRLPNLVGWAERLPKAARVVILDLGDVTRLDSNAALELRTVLTAFRSEQRRLVLAGLSGEQYEQLRQAGAAGVIDPTSVCADLELAVARGLVLLEELKAGDRG